MNPRDVIAQLGPIAATHRPKMWATRLIDNLTDAGFDIVRRPAAGYPIVGPADMEAVGWVANCCNCGRIVDKREKDQGGDPFGAELSDGRWTCSFECWDAVTGEPASPHMPVPAGWVLVPVAALKWLNGEGPDANGHGFGNAPDDNGRGAFWWRTKFNAMLSAAPKPAALTQEPKP